MKTKLILASILLASVSYADTINLKDSATLYHAIVDPANVAINSVPDVNPAVTALKYVAVLLGGFFTAKGIHFFKKRNENKNK